MIRVAIVHQTSLLQLPAVQNAAAALTQQIGQHFFPAWGIIASVRVITDPKQAGPDEWLVYLVNTVADAPEGALAWHARDDRDKPYGIVPVQINLDAGQDPFPSLGHEILEMLPDPETNGGFLSSWNGKDAWLAAECADPVENDLYTITPLHGQPVNMSNFVYPGWFIPGYTGQVDHLNTCKGVPLTITDGGYLSYFQDGEWSDAPAAREKHWHSRWARRRVLHGHARHKAHDIEVEKRHGLKRSNHWPAVERAHLAANPECVVCGKSRVPRNTHHKYPFHYVVSVGRPDLEFDSRNLYTICTSHKEQHHILVGHLDSYESYCPNLDHMLCLTKGLTASQIRALPAWQHAVANRPKPLHEMSAEEKKELRAELDKIYPSK